MPPERELPATAEASTASSKSRRTLLKLLGTSGVGLLAGCTGNDGSTTEGDTDGGQTTTGESSGGDQTTETQEKYGGHYRLAIATKPHLNPLEGISGTDYVFWETMYSRLTTLHPDDLSVVPQLATDWEHNGAFDEWTFMLHEDAVFPTLDNKPVTATDVKRTTEVMRSDDRVPSADRFLGPVDTVDIVDDKTVTFNLTRSDTEYHRRIAETGSTFNIVPAEVLDNRWDELPSTDYGSGPFILEDFQAGGDYNFVKNDEYFGTDEDGNEIPYVDELTITVVPDEISKVTGLTDQRYDGIQGTSRKMFDRIRNGGDANILKNESSEFINVVMNTDMEPFQSVHVRKAMKYATDHKQMLDGINDYGVIGNHTSVAPIHKYYAERGEAISDPFGLEAKPEKAREELEKAGYTGDPALELPPLFFSADLTPQKRPVTQLFQQQMKNVGIEFEIQNGTSDTWLTDYWNQDDKWYVSSWAARAVSTTILDLSFRSDGPWNTARWQNDEFDQLLEEGITATDTETKREKLAKAQEIAHIEGGWVVPVYVNVGGAVNEYVRDVEMPFAGDRSYHHEARLTSEAPQGPE
jgi:peptide/nickel transport system substrate-binding protein